MYLSFLYPSVLVLLIILPVLWVFTLIAQARAMTSTDTRTNLVASLLALTSPRNWVSLTLRIIILITLILALAGTRLVSAVEDITVIYLVDGSDSVTPAQREWAVDYINQSLAERNDDDHAAVVVFGDNALVERTPARLDALARLTSTPIGSRTNIAEAIQLGLALFPADTQKRFVLLSDGEENSGHAMEAAQMAAVRDIPLDVVPLPVENGPDVRVTALEAPGTAREGQTITLQAYLHSTIDTSGKIQIFADGELLDTQNLDIPTGTSSVPINVKINAPGFSRYEVRLEAQGDTQGINNRAAAFTTVEGPPRVLLVATDPARAEPLQRALQATSAQVEITDPNRVPSEQTQLKNYAAIILVDVMAQDVPRPVLDALPIYVSEQGGGLAMIGGRESFGAGGWRRSPIADVLPIELHRKDKQERPDIGLVLVIDHSGSMSESGGGGMTKLDLAKEAVYQATLGLEENDQIGVVVFDTMADWVLPVQPLPDLIDVELALSQFAPDGGTDIRSGIAPAAQALASMDARVKHVILLTDGQASSNYADVIKQMRDNGTTITVVSIGDGANPELRQIATLGGGRYYQVYALADVPRIFLSETVLVIGRDIVEEKFSPLVALPAPIVRGLDDMPPLYGYNTTEPRLAARTILVTPDNKPLLAQWQYGLGRSVAWTSDLKSQWAQQWVQWDNFPQFANNLLDMLLPPKQAETLALDSHTDGNQAILELTLPDNEQTRQGIQIQGRLLNPADRGTSLDFEQVGASRYRAVVPVDTPGAYLAQVAVVDNDGKPLGTTSGGLVVAYSPEYSTRGIQPYLLSDLAAITNGRESPEPPRVFDATDERVGVIQEVARPLLWLALMLWPFDIAIRRLLLRRNDIRAFRTALTNRLRRGSQPAQPARDERMARLMAAKQRAYRRSSQHDSDGPADDGNEPG